MNGSTDRPRGDDARPSATRAYDELPEVVPSAAGTGEPSAGATAARHPDEGPRRSRSRVGDPLSHPRFAAPGTRTKRAWWLLGATLLVPGSAQLVAGRRSIGRIAVRITAAVWAALVLALVLWFVWRTALIWLLTSSITSAVLMVVLVALAIGWVVLWFDTLRLIRPGLLGTGMKRAVIVVTVLAMLVTGGGLGYAAHLVSVARGAISHTFAGGLPFAPSEGRYNILLMGGDAGEDREGRRPDSMTVLSVDASSGQTVTVSIPRNLQNVPFPSGSPMSTVYPEGFNCGDECIMNAIYTDVMQNHKDLYEGVADPGAQATKEAAEGVTGLKIQAYALIDMDGFASLVDALGGIDLNVGGRVPMGGGTNLDTGEKNPILGWIEPGTQHMDGYHALWYARSREGATDYDRQARQRCVQAAMLAQLDPVTVVTKFDDLARSGQQILETDIPQSSIGSMVSVATKAQHHELQSYAAGPPYYDQSFPTYPDYARFQSDLADVLKKADGAQAASSSGGTAASSSAAAAHASGAAPAGGVSVLGSGPGIGTAAVVPAALTAPAGLKLPAEEQLSPNGTCSLPQ
ncbi:LytR family transcriptional regulator [Kocuria tytonicola]|uniref:LytR family transcriptional regulator n=2 Tax=Kocuria tytonicola TaxID=2055946 RepID=A0A3L9L113_9MICC|nr:LCP family protein [Kocuria tytonicola]RLY92251.1 LytR family transcriptional regulator [Kocuria tytonicola]